MEADEERQEVCSPDNRQATPLKAKGMYVRQVCACSCKARRPKMLVEKDILRPSEVARYPRVFR